MGSNSNRNETKNEQLNRFASNIRNGDTSSFNWQTSKGAEIRGKLGIEKGNQFIKEMSKYK